MNRIALTTLAISIIASATACSSSNKPTAAQYDDTAQAIASATATGSGGGDVGSMSDSASIALGTTPQGFTVAGEGHVQGTRLGVDYNYTVTCKSAAGVAGSCTAATDQASVEVAWSGDLSSTNLDASVTRTGSWTLTGLQSATASFSGHGTFSFDATLRSVFRPGATATYSFDADATYSAVQIDTAQHQVIGGAASFDVAAKATASGTAHDGSASFDVHAELTFHADHTADLVLDGSRHYTIDATTGAVVHIGA